MSVCGPTDEECGSEDGAPVREMYEAKAVSQVVRVLTVLAYLLSVSLAAILLSVYYVCVWQSPKLPPLNDTGEGQLSRQRADPEPSAAVAYTQPATGGGDTTVSEAPTTATPPLEPSSLPASTDPPDPPDPYPPPSAPYVHNSTYNATDVNMTDPWPTWLMPNVNATDQQR